MADNFNTLDSALTDHYGVQNYFAPNGELIAVPLYKLVGDTFFDSVLDTRKWVPVTGTGGSATVSLGQMQLSTGTTANNATSLTSFHTARFTGLAPNKLRTPLQIYDGGTVNNVRRWGCFPASGTDGAFFELYETTLRCVTRKNSTDTVIASGNFNGQYGTAFSVGTNSHFYEIIYQPRQVIFLADNKIIHTVYAAAAPWTGNLHLPIRYENFNINGSTTNVELDVRLGVIARFGIPETQNSGVLQEGLTAGVQLKYGPGNLETAVISDVSNGAVITLYDGTSTSGRKMFSSGAMGPQTAPFTIPFGKVPFNDGLFLTVTGAACNVKVTFD